MITVHAPISSVVDSEFRYVVNHVLTRRLRLDWEIKPSPGQRVLLTRGDSPARIEFPDVFFAAASEHWLDRASCPVEPVSELKLDSFVLGESLPVLYGEKTQLEIESDIIRCPIDIFGSVFFMLSRYEEAVVRNRDEHDRFRGGDSIAYRAGFLDRPLADEYIELVRTFLNRLWPEIAGTTDTPSVEVSCDLDLPFAYGIEREGTLRGFASDIVTHRSFSRAANRLRALSNPATADDLDPYFRGTIEITGANKEWNSPVRFFCIPIPTNSRFDRAPPLNQQRMAKLLNLLKEQGQAFGCHPGYESSHNPESMKLSFEMYKSHLHPSDDGVAELHSRQHYLRWDYASTARLLEQNQVSVDHSMGYADQSGFRAGTCHRYAIYDLFEKRVLNVDEQPLICMEATLLDRHYLGLSYSDALQKIHSLKRKSDAVGGCFTLLWHNSSLNHAGERDCYREAIKIVRQ